MHRGIEHLRREQRAPRHPGATASSRDRDRVLAIVDEHYAGSNAVIHSYIQELLRQVPTLSRLDLVFRGAYRGPRIRRAGTSVDLHTLQGPLRPWDVRPSLAERLLPGRLRSMHLRLSDRNRWLANFAPIDTKLLRLLFHAERMRAIVCFTHSLHLARQIARWAHIFCASRVPHIVCVTPQLRADVNVLADLEWLRVTLLHDGEVHAVVGGEPPPPSRTQGIGFAEPQPLSFFDPVSYPYRHEFSRSRVDWSSWIGPACPQPARVRDVVLLIRPDWMSCGSGTYFESLSTYFRARDSLLIDIAIWPFNVPYSRDDRYKKLDEEEKSIGAALHFGLRRTASPLRVLRQLPKLLRTPPTTVTTQNLFAYNLVACPKVLTAAIRHARINIVYLNHYFTCSFAKDLIGGRKFYLDTHDIQSVNYLQEGYRNRLTGRMDTFASMFRDELKVLRRAQRLSFVSLAEMALVTGHLDDASVLNFIALPHIDTLPPKPLDPRRRPRLLIVASGNRANGRSLEWFFDRVWPQATSIWNEHMPSRKMRLDVVGSVAAHFAGRHYEGVTFHGIVDRVDDRYKGCDLVILPVIAGSGAAMKTIEALLYGRPVVGTQHAYRGLPPTVVEHLDPAPTAEDMAREIVGLLSLAPKLEARSRATRLAGEALRAQQYFESLTAALDAVRT
jgi:hypothetical protein